MCWPRAPWGTSPGRPQDDAGRGDQFHRSRSPVRVGPGGRRRRDTTTTRSPPRPTTRDRRPVGPLTPRWLLIAGGYERNSLRRICRGRGRAGQNGGFVSVRPRRSSRRSKAGGERGRPRIVAVRAWTRRCLKAHRARRARETWSCFRPDAPATTCFTISSERGERFRKIVHAADRRGGFPDPERRFHGL